MRKSVLMKKIKVHKWNEIFKIKKKKKKNCLTFDQDFEKKFFAFALRSNPDVSDKPRSPESRSNYQGNEDHRVPRLLKIGLLASKKNTYKTTRNNQ